MHKTSQKGTTLIESLLAILLIAIVALGGAAFIFYSTARVNMERNKRAALEVANARLEELRTASYATIAALDPDKDGTEHMIKWDNNTGTWVPNASDDEEVNINDISFPITTIIKHDDPDGSGNYDYLFVEVSVNYRLADSSAVVTLTTYIPSFS